MSSYLGKKILHKLLFKPSFSATSQVFKKEIWILWNLGISITVYYNWILITNILHSYYQIKTCTTLINWEFLAKFYTEDKQEAHSKNQNSWRKTLTVTWWTMTISPSSKQEILRDHLTEITNWSKGLSYNLHCGLTEFKSILIQYC